jgi:hypothetical protein
LSRGRLRLHWSSVQAHPNEKQEGADIAPAQRSAHAAASSHTRKSSSRCGWARYPRRSCYSNSRSRKRLRRCCKSIADQRRSIHLLPLGRTVASSTTCMVFIVNGKDRLSEPFETVVIGLTKASGRGGIIFRRGMAVFRMDRGGGCCQWAATEIYGRQPIEALI